MDMQRPQKNVLYLILSKLFLFELAGYYFSKNIIDFLYTYSLCLRFLKQFIVFNCTIATVDI